MNDLIWKNEGNSLQLKMVENSSTMERKEGKDVTNVQLISSVVWELPKFQAIPEIAYKGDLSSALSTIPEKLLMIHNVRCCYMWKVGEVGDPNIRETYHNFCDNGTLKEENMIFEHKGLTCALDFLPRKRLRNLQD